MSISHLILFLIICLLIFGPTRLEGIGLSLGKAIRGFKKGMEGIDEEPVKPTASTTASAPATTTEPKV